MDDAARADAGWGEWAPWLFVAGVAAYLSSPVEPGWAEWAAALGCAAALAAFARWRGGRAVDAVLCVALVLAGAAWTAAAAHRAPPALRETLARAEVVGRVASLEMRQNGVRAILADAMISGHEMPMTLRVLIPTRFGEPRPGEIIAFTARLSPPMAPVHPDGFDLPRRAWFQGIGALGFATSPWRTVAPPPSDFGINAARARVEAWRQAIRQRILAQFPPGDTRAGVAAALVMGDMGGIPREVMQDYRDSGLAHMLSISGLHMSLFAGLAFLVLRRGLAMIPALALRYPIKKWAAVTALVLTTVYLLLSGGSVPTQRAWLMTTIALTAILLDRSPFSLRLVGVAALAVAVVDPEAVVGPSFQMSFAAVTALIAGYRSPLARLSLPGLPPVLRWGARGVYGTVASTVIATAATAPFGLYHFGRIAVHSLPANLMAVPPLGLWVMPWGVISAFAMPFGLEALPLRAMAWGIGWINDAAAMASGWPYSLIEAAQMPDLGLVLCAAGGLVLCLGSGRVRRLAAVAVVVGIGSAWLRPPPDLLIANAGAAVAVRAGEGYGFLGSGRSAFVRSVWRSHTAREIVPGVGWRCDREGCVADVAGRRVARAKDVAALGDDCAEAAVVIAPFAVSADLRQRCSAPLLLDEADLAASGAMAVWLDGDGGIARLESVAQRQSRRPWGNGAVDDDEAEPQ